MTKEKTVEEIAEDIVLTWSRGKNITCKHEGPSLVDLIAKALRAERQRRFELRSEK